MAADTLPTNGHVIRALRVAYGIQLRELAKDLGISDGYLSNIEQCRRNASAPLLRRIADRLNVPLGAVVTVALPPSEPNPEGLPR